jgi:hypothetical protein
MPLMDGDSADATRYGSNDSNDYSTGDVAAGHEFCANVIANDPSTTGQIPILTSFFEPGIVLLLTSGRSARIADESGSFNTAATSSVPHRNDISIHNQPSIKLCLRASSHCSVSEFV